MQRSLWRRLLALSLLLALLAGSLAAATPVAAAGVVFEGTSTGGSSASATVATASAVPAVAGQLYLAAVSTKPGGVTVRSVSGLGLSWALMRAQCAGRAQTRLEVWWAIGAPTGSTPVSAGLSASALNATIVVARYSGVDAASPLGAVTSANTRGVGGACSGGVDSAAYSVSLPASTAGALAFGAVAMRNRAHTPGSGYAERAELLQGSGGDAVSVALEDKAVVAPGALPVNGSFSGSVDWAVVALEIRPGASNPPANRAPVAQNGTASTAQNTAVAIGLVASDPDGNPLTYRVLSQPAHGTLAGTPPSLTYMPSSGYTGGDSFTFVANDGQLDSNVASVSITVTASPPPPSLRPAPRPRPSPLRRNSVANSTRPMTSSPESCSLFAASRTPPLPSRSCSSRARHMTTHRAHRHDQGPVRSLHPESRRLHPRPPSPSARPAPGRSPQLPCPPRHPLLHPPVG